jgi:hypothetical protein
MPKAQTPMVHSSRRTPYQAYPDRSSRTFQSNSNERASTAWTPEDDQRLMGLRTAGRNWGPIAEQFPGKSANACRKRHERLMEKKNAENWDGINLDLLSSSYMKHREAMWKILGDAIGEKWQTVEAKVGDFFSFR